MKKIFFSIIGITLAIIILVVVKISDNNTKINKTLKFNVGFEEYKDKTLYGADILSIINKASENNDISEEKVEVEIILLSLDKEGNINEVRKPMEALKKAGLDGFIKSFSLTPFECTSIEYSKTKRISKIVVKQLEI